LEARGGKSNPLRIGKMVQGNRKKARKKNKWHGSGKGNGFKKLLRGEKGEARSATMIFGGGRLVRFVRIPDQVESKKKAGRFKG